MLSWFPDLGRQSGPRYLQIADAIGRAIEQRTLVPGARLPTHRELAYHLGMSVHTVSQAYAEAERRGLIVGETGRGTFVRLGAADRESAFILDRRHEDLIDLSTMRAVAGPVHAERLQSAFSALAGAADYPFMTACRPIAGLDAHRRAGSAWLRRRGLNAAPDRILVCNGAAHALMVTLAMLTRPGDLVVTEALVDHGFIGLASVLKFRLQGLPLDSQGIIPEAFEAVCATGAVKVLCATPTFSNPTTAVMGDKRRRRIAAIARRHGVAIVEDDVFGLLDPDSPAPLSSHLPERGYYITSFTKILMAGLRVGYLYAPEPAIARLTAQLRATSWMATPLMAEIASRWVDDGTADALLAWQREQIAAYQAAARDGLANFEVAGPPGCPFLWLRLPAQWRAEAFVAEARAQNVAVTPAEPFVVGRDADPHCVRLCLGGARGLDQVTRGMEVLTSLLRRDPEPALLAL